MTEVSEEEQALLQLNKMALEDQATIDVSDIKRQLKAMQKQMQKLMEQQPQQQPQPDRKNTVVSHGSTNKHAQVYSMWLDHL